MEKEMLNENNLEEVSGGGKVTLILTKSELIDLKKANLIKDDGKIDPAKIPEIKAFLELLGRTEPLHIIYY